MDCVEEGRRRRRRRCFGGEGKQNVAMTCLRYGKWPRRNCPNRFFDPTAIPPFNFAPSALGGRGPIGQSPEGQRQTMMKMKMGPVIVRMGQRDKGGQRTTTDEGESKGRKSGKTDEKKGRGK
jgi:hypothetical protein